MCLLIYKPAGKEISKDHFERGFRTNPDGGGFAYVHEGKVIIRKPFWSVEPMWEECKRLWDKQMIIHFRITTHGGSIPENTHPFDAGGGWVMGHNGVIAKAKPTRDDNGVNESDTRAYIREFIAPLMEYNNDFIKEDSIQELMTNHIGASKLVFINGKGEHVIVNEGLGTWNEGVWYSNCSYSGPRTPARTTTQYNHGNDYYRGSNYGGYGSSRVLIQRVVPTWEQPEKPVICLQRDPNHPHWAQNLRPSTTNGSTTSQQTSSTTTTSTGRPTIPQSLLGSGTSKAFNIDTVHYKNSNFLCCYCKVNIVNDNAYVTFMNPKFKWCRRCHTTHRYVPISVL